MMHTVPSITMALAYLDVTGTTTKDLTEFANPATADPAQAAKSRATFTFRKDTQCLKLLLNFTGDHVKKFQADARCPEGAALLVLAKVLDKPDTNAEAQALYLSRALDVVAQLRGKLAAATHGALNDQETRQAGRPTYQLGSGS